MIVCLCYYYKVQCVTLSNPAISNLNTNNDNSEKYLFSQQILVIYSKINHHITLKIS